MTIQQNNESIIPFFFEKATVQEMVDRFKKEKPDLASTIKIEVVPLESILATLNQSNDEMLKKIRLVPSAETLTFIRSSVQTQQNKPASTSPQPTPTAPKAK